MTRQRRTHLLVLALVPVVVFGAVRCADKTATAPSTNATPASLDPSVEARLAKLHSENDWIGKFHNDALAYVFVSLNRLPAKARDRHTVCETARRSYAEFHKSRRGKNLPAVVDAQFEQFCAGGATPGAARAVALMPLTTGPTRDISADAQGLMDQIVNAVDPSTSYEDLAASVNSIEANAAATLSYDDASAVFAVGSVALNSATYWANNLPSWVPFTNTPDYTQLLTTRAVPPGGDGMSPAFDNGFSTWASEVWNDTKKAAKRAAVGDLRGAIKAVITAGIAEAPIIYDIVLASSAVGSIMAVLQY